MDPRSSKPNDRPTGGTQPAPHGPPRPFDSPFLAPPEQPDEIGRLGRYRVLGELGRGGMGAVYRSEDPRLKRQLAIKVLLPRAAGDPQAVARFRREAQAQAKVTHDNIIVIYGVEEANGVTFITMPLLRGQTLAEALEQNARPPVAEVLRVGREMAEGLAAAHAAGLVHRDIKPANVWLEQPKRRVKILDFGLACGPRVTSASPGRPAASFDVQLTRAGAVSGTPAYMSPEQATARATDHRTDLWSLGVILYQMATGRMPFPGRTPLEVMLAVTHAYPPPAHALAPDLPPLLNNMIGYLLAKDAVHRPPTAEVVAEQLAAIERSLTTQVAQTVSCDRTPDEPNPWVTVAVTGAETDVYSPPRTGAFARAMSARPRKWLWPVVFGILPLVAGVWLASTSLTLKTEPRGKSGMEVGDKEKVTSPSPPRVMRPREARNHEEAVDLFTVNGGVLYWGNNIFATAAAVRSERANCWLRFASGEYNPVRPLHETPKVYRGTVAEPFTDADLDALGLLSVDSFDRIYLIGQNVTDAGIAQVLTLPATKNTSVFVVMNCGVGDETVRHAAALPGLLSLDLSGTQVTDAGLKHLPGEVRKLDKLSLQKTQVTDACVPDLLRLSTLTSLDLRGSAVTEAGYNKLNAALGPKCKIGWVPLNKP